MIDNMQSLQNMYSETKRASLDCLTN